MDKNNRNKSNMIVKMSLDVVMTVLFTLLMKLSFTGIQLHEIIGLGIFVLVVVHNLLNYKWIAAMCKNILSGRIKGKAKFSFALNSLIAVFTTFTVISGILISQSIFPAETTSATSTFSMLHHFAAYSSFVLISMHIGLHWRMILNFMKKAFRIRQENGSFTWLSRGAALIVAVIGIKAMTNQSIQSNFTAPFQLSSNTAAYASVTVKNSSDSATATTINSTNGLVVDTPSLADYLGKLHCSGCHRNCPLTSLQCGRGEYYKEQATTEYNQKYSQSSQTDSQAGNTASTAENNESDATALDYVGIMGVVIGGTYYALGRKQ